MPQFCHTCCPTATRVPSIQQPDHDTKFPARLQSTHCVQEIPHMYSTLNSNYGLEPHVKGTSSLLTHYSQISRLLTASYHLLTSFTVPQNRHGRITLSFSLIRLVPNLFLYCKQQSFRYLRLKAKPDCSVLCSFMVGMKALDHWVQHAAISCSLYLQLPHTPPPTIP